MSSKTDAPTSVFPLSCSDFAERLTPFSVLEKETTLAIAVSGGPDSMALAFCVNRWAHQNGKKTIAFIVNHALRPEAATEAETVQRRLEQIGIPAEILVWEHPPITSRVHVLAREARYALLTDACKRHNTTCLFLGHHKDDQAETILMRLIKGSGVSGLAGMAAQTLRDDIHLLRPLLNTSKEQLYETCRAAGLDYVTDPSNLSDKYERGRLRKAKAELEEKGFTTDRLIDLGRQAQKAREALDLSCQLFMEAHGSSDPFGFVHLETPAFLALPEVLALHLLSLSMQDVHRKIYAPEQESLKNLLKSLTVQKEISGRTLYGCIVTKSDKRITIVREASQLQDALILFPGKTVLWDEKWHVSLSADYPAALTVKALGLQEHSVLDELAPALRKNLPQGRARAALPALWQEDRLVLIPDILPALGGGTAQALLSARKKGGPAAL